jgi:hypothetical protein
MWILPMGEEEEYPVLLGLKNEEGRSVEYRLVVEFGSARIAEWPSLGVESGAKWETSLALPVGGSEPKTVYATLYRQDDPDTVYRRVMLSGNVQWQQQHEWGIR